MDQVEFEALKATFPWTEQTFITGVGGIIRVIDRNGNEVPIHTMTRFIEMITKKLSTKAE
jgi:hypothetical protein